MKATLLFIAALAALICTQKAVAQPKRLLAESIRSGSGDFDSIRYYYSGSRGGWHQDAGSDILPRQMVARDGSIPIMYDSALVWNGNQSATGLQLAARYTNTFSAANKVVAAMTHIYGNAPANQGEQYSYDSAGYHTLIGYIDSAVTWPSMAPNYFKRTVYNSSNLPVADSFFDAGQPPIGGFSYRYNGAGQKEEVLQFYYMPGYTLADSARFTWYANGLLRTEQHTIFDTGAAVAGILDTFGYAGNNPAYTYRRNDQYIGSSGWRTIWLARNTLNPANGAFDTLYNYYSNNGGPIPSVPSQILVASYNADSTLSEVACYNNGSPVPGIVYRYYYKEPSPAGVAAAAAIEGALRIYPVPAASSGTISVVAEGLTGRSAYTIIRADGTAVISGTLQPGNVLTLRNLPSGNYLIRCGNLTGRIVVL